MSAPKDGQPTGERGRITKESIASALGLGGPEALKTPENGTGRPLKSPAQIRAEQEGKKPPPDAPGFKRTVVQGGRDAWEFLGRPSTSPLGSGAEGQPVDPEPISREDEAKLREARGETPQRADWAKIDAQREARKIGEQFDKAQDKLKRLVRKEAEVEASRKRRRR